ncbi:MAG: ATP-dependent DNA helicase RecG [Methylococcaceae bacterium]
MKNSGPTHAQRSIASLKGVGAQTLKKLERLGLQSIEDLLFHLPYRYEDRTRLISLANIRVGDHALVTGQIDSVHMTQGHRRTLVLRISDGSGQLFLRFFHHTQEQRRVLIEGQRLQCFGEVRLGFQGLELHHPDLTLLAPGKVSEPEAHLTPIYPLTEGLHQKSLRKLIGQALTTALDDLIDWLPEESLDAGTALPLKKALQQLHAPTAGTPPNSSAMAMARERLVFEELLAHHLSHSRCRLRVQNQPAPPMVANADLTRRFEAALPFRLTQAQQRVIGELLEDLKRPWPMMRLLQGDVGSGKTVVAAFAALTAIGEGYQVAIMAPTELLAEQHARSFEHWLGPLGMKMGLLSGKAKGEARRQCLSALQTGHIALIVGTHALFQDEVEFQKLGLVIIDEQHRFGVHQRLALKEKGQRNGWAPHQLIMTATPIPRTLAMIGYSDLDLSIIDERPPGRTPVKTTVLPASRKEDIIGRIHDWVRLGRQGYWVCTLIEESEMLQAEAAENAAERLKNALPALRIALIHGRLKGALKEAVMASFKEGEIDILVATTVIEVGVDVPNASLMVIENAERLGLAQLHQLRGRVGRGPGEAHCVLVYQPPLGETARERLGILRETDDGFVIAEKDLQIRGPGELLGTRQTGQIVFRIADLSRDALLIDRVHQTAERLMRDHPSHGDPLIERWLGQSAQFMEA